MTRRREQLTAAQRRWRANRREVYLAGRKAADAKYKSKTRGQSKRPAAAVRVSAADLRALGLCVDDFLP